MKKGKRVLFIAILVVTLGLLRFQWQIHMRTVRG